MSGMPKLFSALPAYIGGKRRLCRLIFALLATEIPRDCWRSLTFVDPFLGGGSVSLFAKAQGFRVVCNDLAFRSAAIGRALIANSSETLGQADLAALLREPDSPHPQRAEELYSPSVFSPVHARLLDRVLHNLSPLPEPKRSLGIVLVTKWMLRVQPMGMLRGTDARAAYSGDLDRVSPRRLGHYLKSERLLQPEAWQALAEEVNGGVFPGWGEAHQADVFEFLPSAQGDVVYLDPPYPATRSYEAEYGVLDDLLEGTKRAVSKFSRSARFLPELFGACLQIPVWLISMNNATLGLEDLLELVRRHRRKVKALEVPYRHLGSIASEVKNETNREFIILATE